MGWRRPFKSLGVCASVANAVIEGQRSDEGADEGVCFGGWLMAVVCGALSGCGAGGAQDKAAAPIGSWKGTLATFDVRSDGQVSYKDPGSRIHRQMGMARIQ